MITYDPVLKIFSFSKINDSRYFSGFSTKEIGDSRKAEVPYLFLKDNGIRFRTLVSLEQIHSLNIAVYESKDDNKEKSQRISECDGVITKEKEVAIMVRSADCCPLLFVDKKNGVIGASHQGWRGSIKRMAQKIVDKMIVEGAELKNIKIAIGPAIGPCCYDIDEDRYAEFRSEFDGYSDKIFYFQSGKIHLNLMLLNYLQLLEKGIPKKNIDYFPFCTKCDKVRFFSFRRKKKEDYGEMFSFIINGV